MSTDIIMKTYVDSKLGFSIEYSADWECRIYDKAKVIINHREDIVSFYENYEDDADQYMDNFNISIFDDFGFNPPMSNIEFAKMQVNLKKLSIGEYEIQENGPACVLHYLLYHPSIDRDLRVSEFYFELDKQRRMIISWNTENDKVSKYVPIFMKMLATLVLSS